jgi:hypothetical protein
MPCILRIAIANTSANDHCCAARVSKGGSQRGAMRAR